MTALIVVLIIAALVCLLLCLQIRILAVYTDTLYVYWRFLFFKIRIVPSKEKKEKTSKKQSSKKKQKPKKKKITGFKQLLGDGGLSGFLDLTSEIKKAVRETTLKLFKHLRIRFLNITIKVSGTDAAQTAISFGAVCAIVYPTLAVITDRIDTKTHTVDITADYSGNTTVIDASCELRARVYLVLSIFIRTLVRIVKFKGSSGSSGGTKNQPQNKKSDNNLDLGVVTV